MHGRIDNNMGSKVSGNESSIGHSFPGAKVPRSERARERKFQGTKGPGSESSRERIGQSPIGTFAPGSELARERKGQVPILERYLHHQPSIIQLYPPPRVTCG